MAGLYQQAKILERKVDELNEKVDRLLAAAENDSKDEGRSDEESPDPTVATS